MENFVLNLFSDQLSKVILDFNPNTINASLLSGKGSITNLRLNVDVINEFLNKPPHGTLPFVKFTEIRLSELRAEVTSYTNLKKAPIVLVIEEIHAAAVEPMEYHLDPANTQNKVPSPTPPPSSQARQQYGLLHRILDNLSIKINRIHLTFQTLGKFKTVRRGIWTPPPVSLTLENIEWVSMTESGNPGTPESVWAHNELFAQQNRFRKEGNVPQHRSYIIYKRLSMICHVRLSSEAHYEQTGENKNIKSAALISNTQIDVNVAYIRRLRDAGVTGIDIDVLCHDMDINLDISSLSETNSGINTPQSSGCDVGSFVHMLIGLLHCYYKDRSFVDPLLPDGVRNETKQQISIEEAQAEEGLVESAANTEQEEEIGPDNYMPEISLVDDDDSDSDYEEEPDEEHDEAFLEWKRRHDKQKDGISDDAVPSDGATVDDTNALSQTTSTATAMEKGTKKEEDKEEIEKKAYKRKRKAVIVIASGAQKFEKLSFSLSVSRVNMKLFLPSHSVNAGERHCVELLVEGLAAECIWPKVTGEIGGHVQLSFAYVHVLDLLQRLRENPSNGENSWTSVKLFPLLKIGTRLFQGHDIFALPAYLKNGWSQHLASGVDKCEEFPSMETRQTTWTWDRPRRGKRAFGLKSTISFVDEKLTRWSKTNVNHEACLGVVDILLDSVPIENMVRVFSDYNFLFDARWMSGDWSGEICSDIVAFDSFHIKDYLQPLPAIYQSRGTSSSSSLPSSELRSITAHLGTITIRLPSPGGRISSFGMADVICGFSEATIIVSSQLPKSFLSGKIMACDNSFPIFPNDPSDSSCSLQSQQMLNCETSTQFRMQVSVSNFSVDIVDMHQSLHRYGNNERSLIAPTNVTLMACLEQNGATDQSIIVSILLQEWESNVNLRLLSGALQTLKFHSYNIMLRPNISSQVCDMVENAAKSDGGNKKAVLALCFHLPSISLKCWGEESDLENKLLFQAQAKSFELGSESVKENAENKSVVKVAVDHISVGICSEGDMVELLSIGSETSHVMALAKQASESCPPSDEAAKARDRDGGGLSLRVERHCNDNGSAPSLSCAMDSKAPIALSVSLNVLQIFLKTAVAALSMPCLGHNNISIGDSIFASIHQLRSVFASDQEHADEGVYDEMARNTLMRFFLSEVVVLVEILDEKSFLLLLDDIEIASGQYDKIASLHADSFDESLLVCKHCGGNNQTWLDAYHLIDQETNEASSSFYALKLQHTIMNVVAGTHFDIVVPTNGVDYRFPVPKGGSSKVSSIDVNSMKKIMRHSMRIGRSFSSSYYKLYSMVDASFSGDLSSTAMRFHALILDYHKKVQAGISRLNAEVCSLRKGMFLKERERIGALALASSTACGWVRVGEDSSFSTTRLFTSATFWRYWMVLDKSVILLYKAPGSTTPSFIIPMHYRTKLRSISMSSSSNKNTVVGNHLRQRGFALFDEEEGMELFFVTSNQTEYDMFVSAIGRELSIMTDSEDNSEKVPTGDVSVDIDESTKSIDFLSEAVTVSQRNETAEVDSSLEKAGVADTSDSNDPLSVLDEKDEDPTQYAGEAEEMVEVQLDEFNEAVAVDNIPSQHDKTQEMQMLQNEDAASNKSSTNTSLSMRERLAVAKGKSKLATSKFGSTLKSAKLAASEGSQKMTVLKKTANTKLSSAATLGKASLLQATTAVRSTIHEQSIRTNSSDSMDKHNLSKLEKVNKSMSGAMQRLHIDDKVTKISTAVKSVRSESQVMRQLSSELVSRRKIGIAEEHSDKPVKFDARETFAAISGHPAKVKSIASGAVLKSSSGKLCARTDLQKFDGRWLVDVSASVMEEVIDNETKDLSTNRHTNFEIILTDVCNKAVKHSVKKSVSDLLIFHVAISELLAKTVIAKDHHQTSPFDQLRAVGSLLERMIEGKSQSQITPSVRNMHCEWIKMFVSTLLESYLPEQVIETTVEFLGMNEEDDAIQTRKFADYDALNPNEESCAAAIDTNEAFRTFSNAVSSQTQSAQLDGLLSSANDLGGSHLLEIMMAAYKEACTERDTALATLAVSSVMNDHEIMQKQLARSEAIKQEQAGEMNRQGPSRQSSDDEMLALCKQLGSEIAAKTNAELEINRLKEQMELERKIALAKEADLLEQISKIKK